MEEITIELFLKQLTEDCKVKLSKAREFKEVDNIPPLVLSLSGLTQLGQMLFIIRCNDELSLDKDVGDIKNTFGHMLQNFILDMIQVYTNRISMKDDPLNDAIVSGIKQAQIIYKQVIDLTGVNPWPEFKTTRIPFVL